MRDIAISLLWRLVLLLTAAHALFVSAYDAGVRDTESFYEGEEWDQTPEGDVSV
jgi:hypothetical protein